MGVLKSNARNFIINGAMDYWQRGISFSSGSNQYTADRWGTINGPGSGSVLVERSDVVPDPQVFDYSMKLSGNNHSLDYYSLRQVIEARFISELVNRNGKCFISFWLKSSKTGSMNVLIRTNQGTVTGYLAKIDILNTDYNRYVIEVPETQLPLTINKDNNNGLELIFMLKPFLTNPAPLGWSVSPDGSTTDGTTNFNFTGTDEVFLTGVMINFNAPQDFIRAGGNEAEELRLCQRYFEKSYDIDTPVGTTTNNGTIWQTGNGQQVRPNIRKRVVPVFNIYSSVSGVNGNVYDATSSVDRSINGAVVGQTGFGFLVNGMGATSTAYFHWTADAEF